MFHYLMEEMMLETLKDAKQSIHDNPISSEWRGTNYANFGSIADETLPLNIIANKDITPEEILTELAGGGAADPKVWKPGTFYHQLLETVYDISKRFILDHARRDIFELKNHLDSQKDSNISGIMGRYYGQWLDIKRNLERLWYYESHLLISRLYFYLARYPEWTPNNIADHVFCAKSEYQFDGSKLHISENSKIDLYRQNGTNVVIDVKTGEQKSYHYLTVVGYALALESSPVEVNEVNIGCIIYVDFSNRDDPIPKIKCVFHPLSDAYRQDFIEELRGKINWYAMNK